MVRRIPDLFPRVLDDPAWARRYAESSARRNKAIAKRFLDVLRETGFEKARILDAGCGAGDVLIELARACPEANMVGIDLSQLLLDVARNAAESAGVAGRVRFEKGDVEAMPFEDGSFDVVISLNMLHYVGDPVAMLNEIERVLAPPRGAGAGCPQAVVAGAVDAGDEDGLYRRGGQGAAAAVEAAAVGTDRVPAGLHRWGR